MDIYKYIGLFKKKFVSSSSRNRFYHCLRLTSTNMADSNRCQWMVFKNNQLHDYLQSKTIYLQALSKRS